MYDYMLPLIAAWFWALMPFLIFFAMAAVLNAGAGALVAWKNKVFDLECLPLFLQAAVLYLFAWLTTEVLFFAPTLLGLEETAGIIEFFGALAPKAVYVTILVGKYGTSIYRNVKEILEEELPFQRLE
jgi:hypothetical protein